MLIISKGIASKTLEINKMQKIKQKLIGTWKLESIIVKNGDAILYPFGKEVKGVLFYSENYMSVQIMMPMKLPLTEEQRKNIQIEMLAQSLNTVGYMGYFGAYEVDEKNETIIHHVEGSISQQLVGWKQLRKYKFEVEKLVLSTGNMYLKWNKL